MTLEEIVSMIGTQGFAIAMCVSLLWFTAKLVIRILDEKKSDTDRVLKIEERSIDAINTNTAVMEKLTTMIQVMVNGKPGE